MYIPEILFDCIDHPGAWGVNVYCPSDDTTEISEFIKQTFASEWDKALEKTTHLEFFRDLPDNPNPMDIAIKDNCIILTGEDLVIVYNEDVGEVNVGDAVEALEETLHQLVAKYPNVRYEGQVAFLWSDTHGGEVEQFELSYPEPIERFTDKTYDFIGKAFADIAWDRFDLYEEEFIPALKFFHAYSKWFAPDTIDKALGVAESDFGKDFRTQLEEVLKELEEGKAE